MMFICVCHTRFSEHRGHWVSDWSSIQNENEVTSML